MTKRYSFLFKMLTAIAKDMITVDGSKPLDPEMFARNIDEKRKAA